jgi:hypothetical protein
MPEEVEKVTLDPSGTWKWTGDVFGSTIASTLRLNWQDNVLTGTYQASLGELNEPVPIVGAEVDGNKILFAVRSRFRERNVALLYTGRLQNEEIVGTGEVDYAGQVRKIDWKAQRVVELDDVVGQWVLKYEGRNGITESTLTLSNDGDKLSGTFSAPFFGDAPVRDIELKGHELSFVVAFQFENREITMRFKTEPRGTRISGTIVTDTVGQPQERRFAGTRVEKEAAGS